MNKSLLIVFTLFTGLLFGEEFQILSGDILRLDDFEARDAMTCPDLVDSCIYVCDDGSSNPCHPENLYAIVVDSSTGDTVTLGSRFRIYFPWEYAGMSADKFRVTASWPCLSPTAVFASGDYAWWDVIGHGACPGTVQGSIWYGDDCEDDDGNIGADHCLELVGRFCFAPGDTLDWPEESDQSISSDTCNACWMSSAAWDDYDTYPYSDPVLSPGTCTIFDHCHHSEPDSVLCGVGYMDGETDSTVVSIGDDVLPSRFTLNPSYPNPFNGITILSYTLPHESDILLTIYDLQGRLIKTVAQGHRDAGRFVVSWNGTGDQEQAVSSGVYLVQLQAGSHVAKRKVVYLK